MVFGEVLELSTPSLGITQSSVRSSSPASTLSTPSLGITRWDNLYGFRGSIGAFNSLSRDHLLPMDTTDRGGGMKLSTPSLGITKLYFDKTGIGNVIAFNSLSRDHRDLIRREGWWLASELSTPSLGITFLMPEGSEENLQLYLSTPSLGITEPDSGIFRLSAAFCRGTSSHK